MENESIETLKTTKNFCPAPFVSLCTRTQGKPKLCPMGLKKDYIEVDGEMISLDRQNLMKHWNSTEMKTIRKKMLADEEVPECEACRNQASRGLATMRDFYIRSYFDRATTPIKEASLNDGKLKSPPFLWDLSTGNACNLACRICSPTNSSRMEIELKKNRESLEKPLSVLLDDWESKKIIFKNADNYFKDIVSQYSDSITELKLQGGEPSFLKSFWEMLEELSAQGKSQNIDLLFFTNVTQLSDEQITLLNTFRSGRIFCSIDAYGDENDFLRFPSRWAEIEKNMHRFSNLKDSWVIVVKSSISHYNCLTYYKLLEWTDTFFKEHFRRGMVDLHDVYIPSHLRADLIPKDQRMAAWVKLEKLAKDMWLFNESPKKEVNSRCLSEMKRILSMPEIDPEVGEKLKGQARLAIQNFDDLRLQNSYKLFPHLHEGLQYHERG